MAQAPVTGQYPAARNTPSLTVPFAQTAVGQLITKANLEDDHHPINIQAISGKTRGATILLDDNTLYWATGSHASSPWLLLGGGGSGGGGSVESVNGVKPDEDGDVSLTIPQGTVKSVNGVEPDAAGAVQINVIKTINGSGPDVSGNIVVSTSQNLAYHSEPTLTIDDTSDGKFYILNGTGQTVTFAKMTKSIQCSFAGTASLTITQGGATQFIVEGDWAAPVPAGRAVKLLNNGDLWVMDRPVTAPAAP